SKIGRTDEAYHRYGLKVATGPTYLAIFRETIKRYPERDRRQVLLDLIEARGERGKWFAAAKDAGLLDVALQCARDAAAEPATLVRSNLPSEMKSFYLNADKRFRAPINHLLC